MGLSVALRREGLPGWMGPKSGNEPSLEPAAENATQAVHE